MTKNNFLKTLALSAVLCLGSVVQAQVKVGNNPTTINANSVLEMESTNKGMLLPRLGLSATTSFSPLAAHVAGMTVYNTATAGDVTPGFYFNDGTKWVRIVGATAGSGSGATTAGPLITITNGAGATMTAMTVATDTTALKSFISSAVQNGAITGKNTTAGSLITVTNGAGATLTAMTVAVDTNALKTMLTNAGYDNTTDRFVENAGNTIVSTGNVGIGTTSPLTKLDVRGADSANSIITVGTTGAAYGALFLGNASHGLFRGYFGTTGNQNDVALYTTSGNLSLSAHKASGPMLTISGTGHTGIGTETPTNRLHVVNTSNPLRLVGLQAGASSDEVMTTDATGVARKLTMSALGSALSATEPWFKKGAGTGSTSNTDTVYIMGNVGIGTANPIAKLHLYMQATDSAVIDHINDFGPNGQIRLYNLGNDGTKVGITYDGQGGGGAAHVFGRNDISGWGTYQAFYTHANPASNSGGLTEAMRITSEQRVGIGTKTPQFDLDVTNSTANGVIKINSATGFTSQLRFYENNLSKWKVENTTIASNSGLSITNLKTTSTAFNTSALHILDTNNYIGIGTTTPTTRLHVNATSDPLRLQGLQASAGEEILTVDATGVVHKAAIGTEYVGTSIVNVDTALPWAGATPNMLTVDTLRLEPGTYLITMCAPIYNAGATCTPSNYYHMQFFDYTAAGGSSSVNANMIESVIATPPVNMPAGQASSTMFIDRTFTYTVTAARTYGLKLGYITCGTVRTIAPGFHRAHKLTAVRLK